MTQKQSPQPIFEENRGTSNVGISIEKIVSKVIDSWGLFAICLAASMVVAMLYLRYSTPIYVAHAKVLVNDNKAGMSEGRIFQDLGVSSGVSTVDNEIEVFKSKILMKKVIEDLNLNIRYYAAGRIKTTELYEGLPYYIVPLYQKSSIVSSHGYSLKAKENGVLEIQDGAKKILAHPGDTLFLSIGNIIIRANPLAKNELKAIKEFTIVISPIDDAASDYRNALVAELVNRQVSILRLSISDAIPRRAEDIVNKVIDVYLQENIDDRNRVVDGTMQFIDDRLAIVSQELQGIEHDIESFKKSNSLTSLDAESKALLEDTRSNQKQVIQQEVQLRIIESLEAFLHNQNEHNQIIPSTLLVTDNSVAEAVNNYNKLQGQREQLLLSYTETSPYVKNLDAQLSKLKASIERSLASAKRNYQISIGELNRVSGGIGEEIKNVPQKERLFLEHSRQQNIKQELYLFLLKKREETAISKSATIASGRIIDVAESEKLPVAPDKSRVLLAAFVIGLLVPGGRLILQELLSLKVTDKNELLSLTTMSILGEIEHNNTPNDIVVDRDSRTLISEQFRILRTNLQFLLPKKDEKVIMLTSSMSGEGKSFAAINLATVLALSGKKVALLEMDLRKPQVSVTLRLKYSAGFSNYAIGASNLSSIIYPSNVLDNLYIMPAGTIPPNPSELVMLPVVDEMFKTLRSEFDYIIVDTAPIGLVTDAQLLSTHADAILYVVRQNYTLKSQIKNAEALHRNDMMPRMCIVLNDIRSKRVNGYGGYGYGTSPKNDYFEVSPQKNIKNTIKKLSNSIVKTNKTTYE